MINIDDIKEHVDVSGDSDSTGIYMTSHSSVKRVTISSSINSIQIFSDNIPAIEVKSDNKPEEPKISLYLYGKVFSDDIYKTIKYIGHDFVINHVNEIYVYIFYATEKHYTRNDILGLVRKYKLEKL